MRVVRNKGCRPLMPYFGGKSFHADWINAHLPAQADAYVEVFSGSAAVGLSRPRAKIEVFNDFDPAVANLYRAVQRDPDELRAKLGYTFYSRAEHAWCSEQEQERQAGVEIEPTEWARQYLVLIGQSFAGLFDASFGYARQSGVSSFHRVALLVPPVAARLRLALIENLHFADLIAKYSHLGEQAVWYLDPPYLPETRVSKNDYRCEMTLDDHKQLLDMAQQIDGAVAISGYPSELYQAALTGWRRVTKEVACLASNVSPRSGTVAKPRRTECLWLNATAQERLKQKLSRRM